MKQYLSRIRYDKKSLAILIGCLAATGFFIYSVFAANPSLIKEVAVTPTGVVQNPVAPYLLRDGGASGLLGGRVLWTFGDTIFFRKGDSGEDGFSSTAAYAELSSPTVVSEPIDTKGAPAAPLLQLSNGEKAYNRASGDPNERYALWPASVISESSSTSLILYHRLKVHPGNLNYEHLGTGMARINAGATVAQRLTDELFVGKENQYLHAHAEHGGFLYLYNCKNRAGTLLSDCSVARALKSSALNRAAYRYWDGSSWAADINSTARVVPGSTSGFSVAFNPYLGAFVSTTSTGFSKSIIIRTAPAPEGPWSESIVAHTAPGSIYATMQHPELATENGRNIAVSYYLPEENWKGKLQLLRIRLNPRDANPTAPDTSTPANGGGSAGSVSGAATSTQAAADYGQSGASGSAQDETANAEALVGSAAESDEAEEPQQPKSFWQSIWSIITAPWRWFVGLF